MNQAFLDSIRSQTLDRIYTDVQEQKRVMVTGTTDASSALIAAQLVTRLGKRVLVVTANDLKAGKTAEDARQFVGLRAACLPGGELDLTRSTSSHESAWRRLETLTQVVMGETRLLVTSMDALQQRMGNAELFRASVVRFAPGDQVDPVELIGQLVQMGYERVPMVEGKGQCALRGDILDCYPPSSQSGLRIEFFGDEVDTVRSFDCISQRTLEQLDRALIPPACEVLLDEDESQQAADRMRRALQKGRRQVDIMGSAFDDLPPLPDDDDELEAIFDKKVAPKVKQKDISVTRQMELDRRFAALMQDADTLESGVPFRRMRTWLTVMTKEHSALTDWFRADAVVLVQPDALRDRADERMKGFAADLESAMERGEAVEEQSGLMMDWAGCLDCLQNMSMVMTS
ncbi:MAG: hypothetical protein Q4C54_09230 [Clostridia bacterium]|nr:hypothetical protein [Clostridia bacterium]